jgi:ribosome maturation factor RimP
MVTNESLIELLEPAIKSLGYELVDIELRLGSHSLVRIFVDKTGGITLEDCEVVSNQVSGVLDVEDPLPGHYTLEVSSPGLDRVLRTADHFRKFAGSMVKVQSKALVAGRKRFKGLLKGIEDEEITLEVDGAEVKIALVNVHSARLVPDL